MSPSEKTKKVFICQSNYIPWKGYFDAINLADEFIIYDDMQFTKNDWRNRNQIKTSQGLQWLTIPVLISGKFGQKINETKIADQSWQIKHWRAIQFNYAKAKYFSAYKDFFFELYDVVKSEYLSEVNYFFLSSLCKLLGITTKIRRSSEFNLIEGRNERLLDLCIQTGTTDYYSGPAAKNYIDESLFLESGIKLHYIDYTNYPAYTQQWGDFVHAVSVIDLIMNEGENASNYMKSFSSVPMKKEI
ncbi:MAG: WbqC family protein [Bacteroidetes bacterium]|nr:WbqC family protein [Bacteroidota bacterium]